MKEVKIKLNDIDKVKDFANLTTYKVAGDVDLESGKYVIDGKSIMGIFSLDLSKPITMRVSDDTDLTPFEKFFVE